MNDGVGYGSALARALVGAQRQSELQVFFGGTIAGSDSQFAITKCIGASTAALHGLQIVAGLGLGGRVLREGRAAAVTDYFQSPHITHEYYEAVAAEHLRSIAAVPVLAGGQVRGVLYGALHAPEQIGSKSMRALHEFAAKLSFDIAVEEATQKRLQEVETAELLRASREQPTVSELENVRIAHAELREFAQGLADPEQRQQLDHILVRLDGSRNGRERVKSGAHISLAARETDVLTLVAVGCTNGEIGERLGLGRETVKSYLRNIMRKLDSHSRTETVSRARELGMLP